MRQLQIVALALGLLGVGCYVPEKPQGGGPAKPPPRYYVHCDTCEWCKGTYKTSQDAEKVVRKHNIKVHDYQRIAYFDTAKCR